MMEKKFNGSYIVDIIGSKLECLITPVQAGANLAREAMTDLLKFTFNISLYYPNVSVKTILVYLNLAHRCLDD